MEEGNWTEAGGDEVIIATTVFKRAKSVICEGDSKGDQEGMTTRPRHRAGAGQQTDRSWCDNMLYSPTYR
jgi:hypothetical protein